MGQLMSGSRHRGARPRPFVVQGTAQDRTFRVELHRAGQPPAALGRTAGVAAHHTSLVPYIGRLRLNGDTASGQLVLLDDATGAVVARRHLTAPDR